MFLNHLDWDASGAKRSGVRLPASASFVFLEGSLMRQG